MIRPSTLPSAGVAAASLLLGVALLVLPSSTHERSAQATTVQAPEVSARPAVETVATGNRAPAAPATGGTVLAPRPPATAGMVVGIDPETGQLGMPTPEQMQKLSELQQPQVDHSAEGLVEVHHPDGSVSVDLQGRFQEYATVRVGPDGKLIYQCVDGAENAKRAVKSSAPVGSAHSIDASAPNPSALEER